MGSFWNESWLVVRRLAHSPLFTALTLTTLAVGIGAALALCVAAGIAVVVGWRLLKYMPVRWVTGGAALIMLALAGTSIAAAVG